MKMIHPMRHRHNFITRMVAYPDRSTRAMVTTYFGLVLTPQVDLLAQNLVPNPGFEQYTNCPPDFSCLDLAAPWTDPGSTPDYFHSCALNWWVSTPNNLFGEQIPHSGDAYAGLYAYLDSTIQGWQYREYIMVPLTDTLENGLCYELSMYVSLAGHVSKVAIADMGVYFSDSAAQQIVMNPMPFVPQLDHLGGMLSDTTNWTFISGLYEAHGGEAYLAIGNFHDDASMTSMIIDSSAGERKSYYFVDDVSLELVKPSSGSSCGSLGIEDPAAGTTWWLPDPFRDELIIETSMPGQVKVTIWDMNGRAVLMARFSQRVTLGLDHLAKGLYAIEVIDQIGPGARGKFIKQ